MRQALQAIENEQYIESVIYCTYAIKTDSIHVDAWYLRSYSYYYGGNAAKALSDINTALALNSQNARFWLLRAQINYALKNFGDAWRDFRKARKLDPKLSIFFVTNSLFSPILPGKNSR